MKTETIGDRWLSAWRSRPAWCGCKRARHSSPGNFHNAATPGLWREALRVVISARLNFSAGWHGRGDFIARYQTKCGMPTNARIIAPAYPPGDK